VNCFSYVSIREWVYNVQPDRAFGFIIYLIYTVNINCIYSYRQEGSKFKSPSEEISPSPYSPRPTLGPIRSPRQWTLPYFLGGKAAGASCWLLTANYRRNWEWVELYFWSPSTPLWPEQWQRLVAIQDERVVSEVYSFLGCEAVLIVNWLPTFRKSLLPPFSG
jgi:hypothetical protein